MANLKIAVVGLPGKWSTETLADAVAERTGFRLVVDMKEVALNLASSELIYRGQDLCQLDAILIKKIDSTYSPNVLDRLELLRVAENAGVKIFSRPENILRLIDRLSCTVSLRNAGIPMPETMITEDINTAVATVKSYGSAIFKPLYSTKAQGMCVLEKSMGKHNIQKAVASFKANNPMMYIQKMKKLGGRDMGLMFLDGHYLGAYARVSKNNAWNTTINSGGAYAEAHPSAAIIKTADRAQSLFGLTYTTVDVAETNDGAVIFEVSAFGGFKGAKEGINMDIADIYVDHILQQLKAEKNYKLVPMNKSIRVQT